MKTVLGDDDGFIRVPVISVGQPVNTPVGDASASPAARRIEATSKARSVVGSARVSRARWCQTRRRLMDLELDAEVAEIRHHLETVRRREQRHDLVNALAAAEGAAMLLAREALDASDRAVLAEVLRSAMSALHDLLVAEPEDEHVSLASVAASLAADPAWRDRVLVGVAPDLVVVGPAGSTAQLTEALRRLLGHANARQPSGSLHLRGCRNGDRVELWVDDLGPGLTAEQRRRIRQRNDARSLRPNATNGLGVAIRLARAEGGYVLVEARPGGGESFGISWPVPVA
jgi:signal transduction histidine kinase